MAKSLLSKASCFFLLLLPAGYFIPDGASAECDSVTVKLEITQPASATEKGVVEAVVSGAEKPIHYFFYKPNGELLSKDFTSGKAENIDRGIYYCTVRDGRGCIKKTEFKID